MIPAEMDWARCIVLGVRAFHTARAADAVHCAGAVAPPTATQHVKCTLAEAMPGLSLEALAYEETVLLLASPADLGDADASLNVGHNIDFDFGKIGLGQYFQHLFSTCIGVTAVVVVRPPETYCILIDRAGRAAFRDSHRRAQLDFKDPEGFFTWLGSDCSVFAAMASCPTECNAVALYRLIHSHWNTPVGEAVTTDTQSQAPSVTTAAPLTMRVEAGEVPDPGTCSKLYEDLLNENARLVEILQAATSAGFVMPVHTGENIVQPGNSTVVAPDLPVLSKKECQGQPAPVHPSSKQDDNDDIEGHWVLDF